MGGGAAMRAASKVAGLGFGNGGLRGVSSDHPISAVARRATRPASATVSTAEDLKSNVLVSSQNGDIDGSMQRRPSWEIEDWEFAGGNEELIVEAGEPIPRLVFGGAPTLEEAKEATTELAVALEQIYHSSPRTSGKAVSNDHCSPLLSDSEVSENKACVKIENTVAPPLPKHAQQAFKLLKESTALQTVVASIATDKVVWDSIMKNEAVVEYFQSQKTNVEQPNEESVVESNFSIRQTSTTESVDSSASRNGFMSFLDNIKHSVVDMMSSLSGYFMHLFGGSDSDKEYANGNGSGGASFMEVAVGSSLVGLAIMVVMVVVLKRG